MKILARNIVPLVALLVIAASLVLGAAFGASGLVLAFGILTLVAVLSGFIVFGN